MSPNPDRMRAILGPRTMRGYAEGGEATEEGTEEKIEMLIGQALLDAFDSRDPQMIYEAFEIAQKQCDKDD